MCTFSFKVQGRQAYNKIPKASWNGPEEKESTICGPRDEILFYNPILNRYCLSKAVIFSYWNRRRHRAIRSICINSKNCMVEIPPVHIIYIKRIFTLHAPSTWLGLTMGATKPNVHTHLPTDCAATLQVPAGLHATLRSTAHSTVTATEASVSSPCHAAVPASLVMSARQSWTIICCCWTVINPYGCYRLPERISCMPLFGLPSFTFFLLFYY
jgi:hypothetical protein